MGAAQRLGFGPYVRIVTPPALGGGDTLEAPLMFETAHNLRSAQRYLLAPPLAAKFGQDAVSICDISAKGARFRHNRPIEAGSKQMLRLPLEGQLKPVALEATVIWTQSDTSSPGYFLSGARMLGAPEVLTALLVQLGTLNRTSRIEELRSTDRFFVTPSLDGSFDGHVVRFDNLSARGACIETRDEIENGLEGELRFRVPSTAVSIVVPAQVRWTGLKSITGEERRIYRAGVLITETPERMRLAIGHLCESGRASLDTQSLRLKLKILRARARQHAPEFPQVETAGIPAEQYLLISGVREELRLNPEEAMFWYRKARLMIADPATRNVAPPIASHPDALAVWEYLDRSVDPSIVSRAFELK